MYAYPITVLLMNTYPIMVLLLNAYPIGLPQLYPELWFRILGFLPWDWSWCSFSRVSVPCWVRIRLGVRSGQGWG